MRQRREDDPNFISSGEENPHSKAYPKAINNDRVSFGVIGCGQVGRAVVNGVIERGAIEPKDVVISTRQPGQVSELTSIRGSWYKVSAGYNNVACAEHADVLVVCVPPSALQNVAKEIAAAIRPTTVVIVVASGMFTVKLQQMFGTNAVCRVSVDNQLVKRYASKADALDTKIDDEVVQRIMLKNLRQSVEELQLHLNALGASVEGTPPISHPQTYLSLESAFYHLIESFSSCPSTHRSWIREFRDGGG